MDVLEEVNLCFGNGDIGLGELKKRSDRQLTRMLCVAASKGLSKAVKFLLDLGAFIDGFPDENMVPLLWSLQAKEPGVAQLLVDCGANVNALDCDGRVVLHFIAASGDWDGVMWLIEHGADVDVKDSFNVTPLIACLGAVSRREDPRLEQIAKALIERGADVNATSDTDHWTPLFFAAQNGQFYLAKYLISCGAKVNVKDLKNCTPLHLAVVGKSLELVQNLKSRQKN